MAINGVCAECGFQFGVRADEGYDDGPCPICQPLVRLGEANSPAPSRTTEQILDRIRSGEWTDDAEILDLAFDLQSRIRRGLRRGLRLGEAVEVELATIAVQLAQIQDARPLARRLWEVAYHSAAGASALPASGPLTSAVGS